MSHDHRKQKRTQNQIKGKYLPGDNKGLIQLVNDIDNYIVFGDTVNGWAWELPIDKYALK